MGRCGDDSRENFPELSQDILLLTREQLHQLPGYSAWIKKPPSVYALRYGRTGRAVFHGKLSLNSQPEEHMKQISFNTTREEAEIIHAITMRVLKSGNLKHFDPLNLMMDITATHCNGNKLDLQNFLDAPDFDFFHDIFGIIKNLNRTTGKLENFFTPRYSSKLQASA